VGQFDTLGVACGAGRVREDGAVLRSTFIEGSGQFFSLIEDVLIVDNFDSLFEGSGY